MICLCGTYLSNNVIPCSHLYLLLSNEDVNRGLLSAKEARSSTKSKPRSLNQARLVIQQRSKLYSIAKQVFECHVCGRLHIYWLQNHPATSYRPENEKSLNGSLDELASPSYRLLADVDYDKSMDSLIAADGSGKLNITEFQEQFLKVSKRIWIRYNARQIVVEWETGWISEYLYEYGEQP